MGYNFMLEGTLFLKYTLPSLVLNKTFECSVHTNPLDFILFIII